MFDIIIALNTKNGIGKDGKIPWNCPEDLKIFKEKTTHNIVIVGRKTAETLPELKNRIVFYIGETKIDNKNIIQFKELKDALNFAETKYPNKKIYISGGEKLYKCAFTEYAQFIKKIHISRITDNSECDTFFSFLDFINSHNWIIDNEKIITGNKLYHYVLTRETTAENSYLQLLKKVYSQGEIRHTRNGKTYSLFSSNLSFDLRDGFPLLTTKKMFLRGIFEELMFFIRGQTDSKILESKSVKIWKDNSSRSFLDKLGMVNRSEGILGPMYGYQWRNFNSEYDEKNGTPLKKGFDQLQYVIDTIKTDPMSRRIIMTDYNPLQANQGVLFPCHSIIIQFYVSGSFLDMNCYNRSQDLFLGTPFNIASSAFLLTFVAKITGYTPRNLNMCLGDIHIYAQHTESVLTQIKRKPFDFPKLIIDKKFDSIQELESLCWEDIKIVDYIHHGAIIAPMIA